MTYTPELQQAANEAKEFLKSQKELAGHVKAITNLNNQFALNLVTVIERCFNETRLSKSNAFYKTLCLETGHRGSTLIKDSDFMRAFKRITGITDVSDKRVFFREDGAVHIVNNWWETIFIFKTEEVI